MKQEFTNLPRSTISNYQLIREFIIDNNLHEIGNTPFLMTFDAVKRENQDRKLLTLGKKRF